MPETATTPRLAVALGADHAGIVLKGTPVAAPHAFIGTGFEDGHRAARLAKPGLAGKPAA